VHNENDAFLRITDLVKSQIGVDGIIAANDLIAQGALRGLRAAGRDIPIISFDDFPQASLLGVTTLDHDPQTIGRIAAGVLLDRFANPAGENFVTTVMQLRVKEGGEA
jgi:DNA-binding LacI/PurR family transcriptional regulator